MIIQETVSVPLNSRNIKHYESLGYIIPKYFDIKHKKFSIKEGTQIDVKVEHLSKGSHVNVLCQCEICDKQRILKYKQYNPICNKCICQSNEFRKKISKGNSGKIRTSETKRKISLSNKGRTNSTETRLKISLSNIGRPGKFGKDNPNYNSNLTQDERENKRLNIGPWKRKVKERDNYTCQKCGSKEHPHAHHINSYSYFRQERLDENNGVCLCKDCHKQIHKIFGNKTTRNHFEQFIKMKN